jgi:glycosyltransferase involved in cell wall biosynthesis
MRHRIGIYLGGKLVQSGPGRYVQSVLDAIDPGEFDVTIFCKPGGQTEFGFPIHFVSLPGQSPIATVQAPKINGVESARAPEASTARLWAGFGKSAWILSRTFAAHSVDLLHTQDTGCEDSPVAARLAGIGHVVGTFHVDSTYDLAGIRSGFTHRAMEIVSNHALHRAIAVSEATRDDWIRRTHVPDEKVVTIHNGIDPEKFRRRTDRASARARLGLPPSGPVVIGGIGRLDEAKGFIYLIEAMAALSAEFPDAILLIAGDGALKESLMARAAAVGIADRVRFLGFVSDVQSVLDALDIFAMPSLCETLGYAILEAMATELPVVGTTVGGVPEVIVPGQTGFLVPPRDSASLAGALRQLMISQTMRKTLGRAGRQRVVDHFQESVCARTTIDLYRQMLSGAC